MIAVACDVQVQGLGRCFAHTVENNRIFLTCPTIKTINVFDVRHGVINELWGAYRDTMPIVYAKRVDEHTVERMDWKPGHERRVYELERDGWSADLALSCFPTACSSVTRLVLNGADADAVEKAMVAYVKVKVNKMKSDGSYRFVHKDSGEEWDLEKCLHEMAVAIDRELGIKYTYKADVVLDYYNSHAMDIFKA